jgi:hypothetical protein
VVQAARDAFVAGMQPSAATVAVVAVGVAVMALVTLRDRPAAPTQAPAEDEEVAAVPTSGRRSQVHAPAWRPLRHGQPGSRPHPPARPVPSPRRCAPLSSAALIRARYFASSAPAARWNSRARSALARASAARSG